MLDLVGYLAAFCTTISFLPQMIHTIKTRDTKGISLSMYSFFIFGVIMWLIYGIMLNALPVILCNSVTLIFASVIIYYKIKLK